MDMLHKEHRRSSCNRDEPLNHFDSRVAVLASLPLSNSLVLWPIRSELDRSRDQRRSPRYVGVLAAGYVFNLIFAQYGLYLIRV